MKQFDAATQIREVKRVCLLLGCFHTKRSCVRFFFFFPPRNSPTPGMRAPAQKQTSSFTSGVKKEEKRWGGGENSKKRLVLTGTGEGTGEKGQQQASRGDGSDCCSRVVHLQSKSPSVNYCPFCPPPLLLLPLTTTTTTEKKKRKIPTGILEKHTIVLERATRYLGAAAAA